MHRRRTRHRATCALTLGILVVCSGASIGAEPPDEGEKVEQCPDDLRAVVNDMLSDAETRGSIIGAARFGHDGSFYCSDTSGGFTLKLGGYLQTRFMANLRDEAGTGGTEYEGGFQSARTRLIIAGSVPEPGFDFLVLPASGPGGDWFLLDAWARHTFDNGWSVKIGQVKLPFLREWLVSERYLLGVERSDVSSVFASVYGQALEVCHTGETLGVHLAFSDGLRSLNTEFTDPRESDYALTARVEWKPRGEWKQLFDMTALGNDAPATMLGVAVHHQGATASFDDLEIDSLTQYTVDATHEETNWSVMGAVVGRHTVIADGGSRDEYGVLAQGAAFASDKTELFAQYSVLFPDSGVTCDDPFHTLTLGINQYIHAHAAKLTLDAVWFLDPLDNTDIINLSPSTGTGLLASAEEDQLVFRLQFQLLF